MSFKKLDNNFQKLDYLLVTLIEITIPISHIQLDKSKYRKI